MKRWWSDLSQGDRRGLATIAVVVVLAVFWFAVWRPLTHAQANTRTALDRQRLDLAWLQAAAQDVARLQTTPTVASQQRGDVSLLALAEQTARRAGLASAFRRGEPDGTARVRVWLEGASFDQLIRWLEHLESGYAVAVSDASIDRANDTGMVSARLVLAEDTP